MESKEARLTPMLLSMLLMVTALAGCFNGSDDAFDPRAYKQRVRARSEMWYERDEGVNS